MSEAIHYVNGEFRPASQAMLPVGDLGLVRGYGFYEVLRTYGCALFRLS